MRACGILPITKSIEITINGRKWRLDILRKPNSEITKITGKRSVKKKYGREQTLFQAEKVNIKLDQMKNIITEYTLLE